MNFYLNFWKDTMMEPDDNPPVGLILCADRDSTKVQYATAGLDQQLFVSRYLVALPKPEELQALIERDQAVFEEQARYNHSHVNLTALN
jgi:methylaspartate ammonia-lyase